MADYLTLEQAAERLGVEYKTVYRLVRSGVIPAGKIGRIYRIRDEDLEAYFERQKLLVADQAKRTGLPALEGLRCGACDKPILSELSVGGKCGACGREICQACWTIRKIRLCGAHPAGQQQRGTGHGPTDHLKAAQRPVRKNAPVATREQVIARLRAEGKPVVGVDEARLAEETFLRSFGQRLEEVEELLDPLSGLAIPLRKARVRHEVEAPARTHDPLPGNRVSRFVLRIGGWGKSKGCLVLEGRFLSRTDVLRTDGYDAEPIGEADLEAYLNDLVAEAKGNDCFRVAMIASPTGWTGAAAAMVSGRSRSKGFRDRRVGVVLCDLHADEVFIDEGDQRLWPFWPVVAPAAYTEKVKQCVGGIRDKLARKDSLSLADAARVCKADPSWARAAFSELERTGEFTVDELPDLGLVISRSSV